MKSMVMRVGERYGIDCAPLTLDGCNLQYVQSIITILRQTKGKIFDVRQDFSSSLVSHVKLCDAFTLNMIDRVLFTGQKQCGCGRL